MSDNLSKSMSLKEKLLIFFDEEKESELRLKSAQEFIDSFEYCAQNNLYQEILKELYERSQTLLLQNESVFIQEYPQQQIRKQCLELFTKVPNNENNKQYSKPFMNTLMKLIEFENEENTSICVRLLVDIHKTQRPPFSSEVLLFLKFVRNVYKELQNHTNKIFMHPSIYEVESIEQFTIDTRILETFTTTRIVTNERDSQNNRIEYTLLPKSCYSLKVMHEIPVLLVLMYQFHKSYVTNEIASFIPLIMDFLNLMPTEFQKSDTKFNHNLYLDFLAAQVKTLSFLAYVVKFFKRPLVDKYADTLVQGMYRMIVNIPSEVTNMRKEYFIAARHILGVQEIKPRFNKVLSDLMDEDILIGNGYTVNQILRPLAYSTLADLIHFVKNDLSLPMIAKATNMYIKNMHDDTLVFSIQQMSMKLLLNFIEPIKSKSTSTANSSNGQVVAQECRQLLLKILYALVQRLAIVRKYYLPRLENECVSETSVQEKLSVPSTISSNQSEIKPEESFGSTLVSDESKETSVLDLFSKFDEKPIKPEHSLQLALLNLHDLRTLTKHLIHGIKTVTVALTSNSSAKSTMINELTQTTTNSLSTKHLDGYDMKIYCQFLRNALRIMDLYLINYKDNIYIKRTSSTNINPKIIDEKNILESVAHTFLLLSPINFKEVFSTQIKFIINRAISNNCIIQLFHTILGSTNISHSNTNNTSVNQDHSQASGDNSGSNSIPSNASILANLILGYLLDNMEVIGESGAESTLHIRLFKLIFNNVHTNLGCFENVLEQHLKKIVLGCMKYSLSARDPTNFMCLLRYLFRSIGGGAHEKLYKEFLPLLPLMLTGLSRLLRSPHLNQVRDLLGELCVIVPVRLSTLLPHLSLLMEPLVHVLSCNTISQGLRTLELCVDNMSPDYLYQNMYPVRGDIMYTMLQSFRFKNDQVNRTAFKVLGKMGRFNRCDLSQSQFIRVEPWNTEMGPHLTLKLNEYCSGDSGGTSSSDSLVIPISELINTSLTFIKSEKFDQISRDKYDRLDKSFNLLKSYFAQVMLCFDENLNMKNFKLTQFTDMSAVIAAFSFKEDPSVNKCEEDRDPTSDSIPSFPETLRHNEFKLAKDCLVGLIIGCLHEAVRKKSLCDVAVIIDQLIFMSLNEHMQLFNQKKKVFPVLSPTRLLISVLCEIHSYEDKDAVRFGCYFLERIFQLVISSCISIEVASSLHIFVILSEEISRMLHDEAWFVKWGGAAVLLLTTGNLHCSWVLWHLLKQIRALFYALNDLNMQICQYALNMIENCIDYLIQKSFSTDKSEPEDLQWKKTHLEFYNKLLFNFCEYSVKLLLSENDAVRAKASKCLHLICKMSGKHLSHLLTPHCALVKKYLPPNAQDFTGYPLSRQIVILDLNYLFGNNANCLQYDMENENHVKFISEVRTLIETNFGLDDEFPGMGPSSSSTSAGATNSTNQNGKNFNCMWNLPNHDSYGFKYSYLNVEQVKTIALKKAACRLIATLWYLDSEKEKNFQALFKAMCSKYEEVHEVAFKCLHEFIGHTPVSLELRNANLKPLLTTFRENYSLSTNRQLFYCAKLFVASFSERMCESLITNKIKPIVDVLFDRFNKDSYMDIEVEEKFILMIKTVELFHVLQAASNKYIYPLTELVLKVEQRIYSYQTSPLRKPLILYLAKNSADTCALFLQNQTFLDNFYARNFFIDCLGLKEAGPIREYLQTKYVLLMELCSHKRNPPSVVPTPMDESAGSSSGPGTSIVPPPNLTTPVTTGTDKQIENDIHHFALDIIYKLTKFNSDWFLQNKPLTDFIKNYWCSNEFLDRMARIDRIHYSQWKDLDHLIYLIQIYIEQYPDDYEYLFVISKAFKLRILGSHQKLRQFLTQYLKNQTNLWKQSLFRFYVTQVTKHVYVDDFLYMIFSHIILPVFCEALEKSEEPEQKEELLGGPPKPNDDSADDIITLFLNKIIDNQTYLHGGLKVSYYQFSILILEYAPQYVHEISNKKKGHKARIILTFAWPNLTNQSPFMDLLEKYVGLQTLAYLISKFNISRQIIVRVFTCLAKGNIVEPKKVVNAALGVLVPAWLQRKDDINYLVLHTKKVATDDVTSPSHLHIGNLIVRHSDIFYQARGHMQPLLHHFIIRMNNQNFQPEQRRCLLDMIELFIKWDVQSKEEAVKTELSIATSSSMTSHMEKPLNTAQKEVLINLVIRLLMQTLDQSQANSIVVETGCKRILRLVETALHPSVWGPINISLEVLTRYFKFDSPTMPQTTGGNSVAPVPPTPNSINPQVQNQYNNMFNCLDLFNSFIKIMNDANILQNMKIFSKPLCDILANSQITTGRFTKFFGLFLKSLLTRFPAEAANKQKISSHPELVDLYSSILKAIQESFVFYEQNRPSQKSSSRIQSALYLLTVTQQAKQNSYAFVDRCLMNLVNMGIKLVAEIKVNTQNEEVDQLIGAIEIIKSRFNVLGADMRRNKVIKMFQDAISHSKDVKLIKAIINALRNWIKMPKQEEHYAPSNKEKSDLFVRLWDKYPSWSDNHEIQREILSVLLLVFENEQLQIEDIKNTFQVAFCSGILHLSQEVRSKYLELFIDPIKSSTLLERFLFLISANEYDSRCFQNANWIPIFLEVLLLDYKTDEAISISLGKSLPKYVKADPDEIMESIKQENVDQIYTEFSQLGLETDPNAIGASGGTLPSSPPSTTNPNEELTNRYHLFQMKNPQSDKSFKNSIYDYFKLSNIRESRVKAPPNDIQRLFNDHQTKWKSLRKPVASDVMPSILTLSHLSENVSEEIFKHLFIQLWCLIINKPETSSTNQSGATSSGTTSSGNNPYSSDIVALVKQETIKFLCSSNHNQHTGQSLVNPMSCFIEAAVRIPDLLNWLHDSTFTFISMRHNQWFLGAMMLEDINYRLNDMSHSPGIFIDSWNHSSKTESPSRHSIQWNNNTNGDGDFMLSLNTIYDVLELEDYQFGLWSDKCTNLSEKMKESMATAQKGHFDRALKFNIEIDTSDVKPNADFKDVVLKQKYYDFNLRYLKKLGHWDTLDKYLNNSSPSANPINDYFIRAEAQWRKGQWNDVYNTLKNTASTVPEMYKWKSQLMLCHSLIMTKMNINQSGQPDDLLDTNASLNIAAVVAASGTTNTGVVDSNYIESQFQLATQIILHQWKFLPHHWILSERHINLLQACNLSIEGWDALQIFTNIRNSNTTSIAETKSLIKSWKNRLPSANDSFGFWTDVVLWRKSVFEKLIQLQSSTTTDSIRLYRQEIYTLMLELVRNSRKQHLQSSTRSYAERLKASLPEFVSSSFSCYKQECKIKMYEEGQRHSYVECLEMLENIDAQRFKDKKDLAKFFCYKAILFSYFNKGDDSTRNFGYALQIDPYNNKIWSIYADFLESVFSNYPPERRQKASHTTGIFAITALIEAASAPHNSNAVGANSTNNNNSSASSLSGGGQDDRYCVNIAKCMWLMTLDSSNLLMAKHLEEICGKLPATVLLGWCHSLVVSLVRPEARQLEPLLMRLADEYPEAVYWPLNCLSQYLIETGSSVASTNTDNNYISIAKEICTNVLNKIRKNNGAKFFMCQQFCHNIENLAITNPAEKLLGNISRLCSALEDYLAVNLPVENLSIPNNIQVELRLIIDLLVLQNDESDMQVDGADELNIKRWSQWLCISNVDTIKRMYKQYFKSPLSSNVSKKIKEFSCNFDSLDAKKCHDLLRQLLKWLKQTLSDPDIHHFTNEYIDQHSIFLLDLAKSTCELTLPGDLSIPKKKEHRLTIAGVDPQLKTRWINNQLCRELIIKASNGHNVHYLIQTPFNQQMISSAGIYSLWMEMKVLQIFRVVNQCLAKQRQATRRHMQIQVPRMLELNGYGLHLTQQGDPINPILHRDMLNLCKPISGPLSLESIYDWFLRDFAGASSSNQNSTIQDPIKMILGELQQLPSPGSNFVISSTVRKKKMAECIQNIVQSHQGYLSLVKFMRTFLQNAEFYWAARQQMTIQIALINLVSWLFNLSECGPQQYLVNMRKASIQLTGVSIKFDEVAQFKENPVPFRMTSGLMEYLINNGGYQSSALHDHVNQPLTISMLIGAEVLHYCRNGFIALSRAVLRDYIIVWSLLNSDETSALMSQSSAAVPSESFGGSQSDTSVNSLTNPMLERLLTNNIDCVYKKINEDTNCIRNQLQLATSIDQMAQMNLSFKPWI